MLVTHRYRNTDIPCESTFGLLKFIKAQFANMSVESADALAENILPGGGPAAGDADPLEHAPDGFVNTVGSISLQKLTVRFVKEPTPLQLVEATSSVPLPVGKPAGQEGGHGLTGASAAGARAVTIFILIPKPATCA